MGIVRGGSARLAIALVSGFVGWIGCGDTLAATKVDEGFATRSSNGRLHTGLNRGKAGDDVVYWIQWQDLDPRTKVQCTVRKDNASGEVLFEEDGEIDSDEGTYSLCAMETDGEDAGNYWFSQTVGGEKAGERIIVLESGSWWNGLSMYRKWKYGIGGLALVIVGAGWIRKKMGGAAATEGAADADAQGKLAKAGVVIGSKLKESAAPAEPPPPPKPSGEDAYQAFKKRLAVDKAARVGEAEEVLPIAKAARAAGDANTAIAALRGFDKAFPGNSLIPDVFVFTAKLMAEDLKNTDMARKILEHVVAKYPGHDLAQEAKRALQALPPPAA